MSIFILVISCLTTSNLPWFMNLAFQVPMQYYSLQHRTLLSPPDTSTPGRYFCFDSASSFLLELLFHSSPVARFWSGLYKWWNMPVKEPGICVLTLPASCFFPSWCNSVWPGTSFSFLAVPRGMQDLRSLTRDWTRATPNGCGES